MMVTFVCMIVMSCSSDAVAIPYARNHILCDVVIRIRGGMELAPFFQLALTLVAHFRYRAVWNTWRCYIVGDFSRGHWLHEIFRHLLKFQISSWSI